MIKQVKDAAELCFMIFLLFLYCIFVSHKHLDLFLNFLKEFLIFFSFEFWDI